MHLYGQVKLEVMKLKLEYGELGTWVKHKESCEDASSENIWELFP